MNYVSAVYGVIAVIVCTDWLVRGRKDYRGHNARLKQAEKLIRRSSIAPVDGVLMQSESDNMTLGAVQTTWTATDMDEKLELGSGGEEITRFPEYGGLMTRNDE